MISLMIMRVFAIAKTRSLPQSLIQMFTEFIDVVDSDTSCLTKTICDSNIKYITERLNQSILCIKVCANHIWNTDAIEAASNEVDISDAGIFSKRNKSFKRHQIDV